MLRFVIADDSDGPRSMLKRILQQARYEVVAECSDGDQAVAACATHLPDVVLLDVCMQRMNGDVAAVRIVGEQTAKCVIVVSSLSQGRVARPLIARGIGFVA